MDTSIWFYTFSTAAQVMSALIGLFAVFVVYKIQDSSQLLNEARFALSKLLPYVSTNTEGPDPITSEEISLLSDKELLETLAELLIFETNERPFVHNAETVGNITFSINRTTYDYVSRLVVKKKRILSKMAYTLAFSISEIALCLVALVYTQQLIQYWWFIQVSLAAFIGVLFLIAVNTYQITLE